MGLITLMLAMVSMVLTLIAFIPLLGWLNWFFIPISIVSLVLNAIFMNLDVGFKAAAKAGMMISIAAIVIGFFRLTLFWGIL